MDNGHTKEQTNYKRNKLLCKKGILVGRAFLFLLFFLPYNYPISMQAIITFSISFGRIAPHYPQFPLIPSTAPMVHLQGFLLLC